MADTTIIVCYHTAANLVPHSFRVISTLGKTLILQPQFIVPTVISNKMYTMYDFIRDNKDSLLTVYKKRSYNATTLRMLHN